MYVNDGNNVEALVEAFSKVKDIQHPIVVHINTLKGKGYERAELDKETYHWRTPFNIETGESKFGETAEDYSEVTAQYLLKKMKVDGSFIHLGETDAVLLETFLVENREALLLALNGNVVKVKQTRRKKTAVPETPVKEEALAEPVAAQAQPEPAPAAAPGDSDAQLDSLVAELGA